MSISPTNKILSDCQYNIACTLHYFQNSKPKLSDGPAIIPTTESSNDKPKPLAKKSVSVTSVASSMEICRICHCEAEPDQPLISPCLCSGSLQYVHQSCLQRWIKSSDTKKCELCKYEFIMESKMKPITKVSKIFSKGLPWEWKEKTVF